MKVLTEKPRPAKKIAARKRIALIGPYPPPYGGISVHIKRVLQHLENEEVDVDFFCETPEAEVAEEHHTHNFTRLRKIFGLWRMLFNNYDLIHQHSPSPRLRVMLGILARLGKRVYIHVHGASLRDTAESSGILSFLTRRFLKHCHILADNADIARLATRLGARSVAEINAFLPPSFDSFVLSKFEEEYGSHFSGDQFTLSMVGWFEEYKGDDLYGFDTALQAVVRLRDGGHGVIKLVASINGAKSQRVKEWVNQYIEENKLQDNVVFIHDSLEEIWPLYLKSNVFIRPSRSDGSALSILEAAWFETAVIASDCVPRPEGVNTFQTGNAASFCEALEPLIESAGHPANEKIELVSSKRFRYDLFTDIYGISAEV